MAELVDALDIAGMVEFHMPPGMGMDTTRGNKLKQWGIASGVNSVQPSSAQDCHDYHGATMPRVLNANKIMPLSNVAS